MDLMNGCYLMKRMACTAPWLEGGEAYVQGVS